MNELARAARDLLDRRCTSERVRARAPFDEELWSEMTAQGWPALLVPEEQDGLGLGARELAALCHELGRALAPVPFIGTVLATAAGMSPGAQPACVVFEGEQVVLDATPTSVVHGAPGATIEPQAGLDLTRSLALVRGAGGLPLDGPVADLGRLALAADSVGAAERALEMAVAYAKDRVQFGKPIGAFQAVQHLLADMLRHVELARAATERAAVALAEQDARAHEWALMAKAKAGDACVEAIAIGIQVHGGIGYTWEHDIHLYYRRARSNAALLGDPAWCRARLAETVLA